jgi:hypothetical protein
MAAGEPRVEAHEREGRERRGDQDQERPLRGELVAVDLDRIGENVSEMVEVEGERDEQSPNAMAATGRAAR